MVDIIKELRVEIDNHVVVTLMDGRGDRWVTIPSLVECLEMEELVSIYPFKTILYEGHPCPNIPVSLITKYVPTRKADSVQKMLEHEWLYFLGYIRGPRGEGASRKANRESLHLIKKALKLVAMLQYHHGYEPVDVNDYIENYLYGEMLGIMGYHQSVDWEDLSQWELQNLTFAQNAFSSAILLYLSQEELHQIISPKDCLGMLLNNVKADISKTMNSMFMAQELSIKLGNILEFESKY